MSRLIGKWNVMKWNVMEWNAIERIEIYRSHVNYPLFIKKAFPS